MSKDCGCFHPKKSYEFTIIDEMTPFNKDTFNKLKEEKVVKEKEVTLNDVINYYYAFLNKNIWPIFGVSPRDHTDTYTIQDVFRSIQFYGPYYDENRSEERKRIAKVVNTGFLVILNAYNNSDNPRLLLDWFKNIQIPEIKNLIKPNNSAQIAELTAIMNDLVTKQNTTHSQYVRSLQIQEDRLKYAESMLKERQKEYSVFCENAALTRKALEGKIKEIQQKIDALK